MKKVVVVSALVSLMVCGLAVFAVKHFGWLNTKNTIEVREKVIPGSPVLYTADDKGEIVPLDFSSIAEQVKDAVVHIESISTVNSQSRTYDPFEDLLTDPFYEFFFGPGNRSKPKQRMDPRESRGSGSGVIISADGYIITNNHVVKNANRIDITLLDKTKYSAEVIGTDPTTDIALLKIDAAELSPLKFYDSDAVKVGQWVMAVGNPFNLNSTVTAGIVSAKGRSIQILNENYAVESFIQTDAAINPGNSGGALVNLSGELVGINTAIASPTGSYAGYGFAVPSNIVKKVIDDLMNYGVVQRGFLGVMIREVNSDVVNNLDLKTKQGVIVDSLIGNSSAAKAGVLKNDVITSVDGFEVNSVPKLQELIARKSPGDHVLLSVNRDGNLKQFDVLLNNKEGKNELVKARSTETVEDELGAEFENINDDLKNELDIEGGVQVVRLIDGKLSQFTDIREGFIITKVDNKEISSKEDFLKYLLKKKGGVLIEGVYKNRPGVYYYGLGL